MLVPEVGLIVKAMTTALVLVELIGEVLWSFRAILQSDNMTKIIPVGNPKLT